MYTMAFRLQKSLQDYLLSTGLQVHKLIFMETSKVYYDAFENAK